MHTSVDPTGLDNIIVRPVYLRAVNAIVHPEVQVPCSQYFLQKWLPRLGTLRWSLVLSLRTICTQRQPDGTSRGEVCRSDLAGILGVHEATISRILNTAPSSIHHGWRVLQPLTNDDAETLWLGKFIPRLRYKYERDPVAGVTRRVGYVIDVVMDDPLIPDDEERLAVLLAEQLLERGPGSSTVTSPDAPLHTVQQHFNTNSDARDSSGRAKRRAPGAPEQTVKAQKPSSTVSVKEQNITDTATMEEQYVSSHVGVNQQKALHARRWTQHSPTLTLTNNYKFRDISIDLTLTRKRDIRAAISPLVNLAADVLNDHHSKGMFFSTLTQLYPNYVDVFIRALELAENEGQRSRDMNMGAFFVNAIRELAVQAGAEMQLGKRKEIAPSEGAEIEAAITGSHDEDDGRVPDGVQSEAVEGSETVREIASASRFAVSMKQLWPAILQELQRRTTRTNYDMWLRNCQILGVDHDVVVIGAPSAFARDWINDRLITVIQGVLREIVGKDVRVRCEVHQRAGAGTGRKKEL